MAKLLMMMLSVILLSGLDYTFSYQTWKGGYDGGKDKTYQSIMFDEVFHLVHDGWADVYPDVFGLDSFTSSVIFRETARLQCIKPGWWHPENKCEMGLLCLLAHQQILPYHMEMGIVPMLNVTELLFIWIGIQTFGTY